MVWECMGVMCVQLFFFFFFFQAKDGIRALVRSRGLGDVYKRQEYAVAEILVPSKYIGHAPETINIGERFHLRLIAVKNPPKDGVLTSLFKRDYKVNMSFDPLAPLCEKDILVVAGRILDIKRFIES